MGKAARSKLVRREEGPLPAKFDFGPHHLVRSTARWIKAEPDTSGIFEIHEFGETGERPCPRCGGEVVYRYGNWRCISYADPAAGDFRECGWTTARQLRGGDRSTLEKCPDCGGTIVYNGNYFCENLGGEPLGCNWALPHPAVREADRDLSLRLTGESS